MEQAAMLSAASSSSQDLIRRLMRRNPHTPRIGYSETERNIKALGGDVKYAVL
jgi:hypothetical protein